MYRKNRIRLNESQLKRIVNDSVKRVLNETRLDYDVDNFSGRWTKLPDDYIDTEGCLDDPNNGCDPFGDYRDEIIADYNGDEKTAENDYSWNLFDKKPIANGEGIGYSVNKGGVDMDIDRAINRRNKEKYWNDRQLRMANRMKDKWVGGTRDLEDLEDNFNDSLNEAIYRAIRKYLH